MNIKITYLVLFTQTHLYRQEIRWFLTAQKFCSKMLESDEDLTLPMGLQLVRAEQRHVPEMGRICYEAFFKVQEGRQSILDFPSADLAQKVLGMLTGRKDFYSVVALDGSRVVGSNFLSLMDEVAGVGPITVDPTLHGRGIGRALMLDVMDYAKKQGIKKVRLLQDAHNAHSLSLYASLGFEVRESCAVMMPPAAHKDPVEGVRPFKESDLPDVDRLSRRIYKSSRRNEVASASPYGFPVLVKAAEKGPVSGYLMPGIFGHGVAESEGDAIALVKEAGRLQQPDQLKIIFCPLREHGLYRGLLASGCRTVKVMNLMTLGPYEEPAEVWMPSVLY